MSQFLAGSLLLGSGLFFFAPASVYGDFPQLRLVLGGLLLFGAFLCVIYDAVSKALDLKGMTAGDYLMGREAQARVAEFEELGFEQLETLEVEISPEALLVALFHPEHEVYATVFEAAYATEQSKTSYDIISVDAKGQYGLTTGPTNDGCTIPASPGAFRQTIHDAPPSRLLDRHLKGVKHLRDHGLKFEKPQQAFQEIFREAMLRQLFYFRKNPVSGTIISLFRVLTKIHPHKGTLMEQSSFPAQLKRVKL